MKENYFIYFDIMKTIITKKKKSIFFIKKNKRIVFLDNLIFFY